MKKLILIIAIVLILSSINDGIGPKPSVVNADDFIFEQDSLAVGALFTMFKTKGGETPPTPPAPPAPDIVSDCKCNKSTGLISYDGGTSKTQCPCSLGEKQCGCVNCKKSVKNDTSIRALKKLYGSYYVIKATAPWCRPCLTFNSKFLPEFKSVNLVVEERNIDIDRKFVKESGVREIPTFFIATTVDKTYHRRSDGTFYSFTGAEFTVEKASELILELDKQLHPAQDIGVFYERQQPLQASLNGTFWASSKDYINHLRNDPSHKNFVLGWPLEKLSQYELKAIHDDIHAGSLGELHGV